MNLHVALSGALAAALTTGAANTNAATPLDTIVVIGERGVATEPKLAGSVDVISREELAYEHVDDTMELFTRLPGVYISRYNQGLINTDISIRGFAGDGGTPHAKLLIDGIPSNLHNGYSEMDQLFPLGIGSIRVFKGTSDPTHGLYNIAGNYAIETRREVGAREVELSYGSFDSREIQGYVGLEHGSLEHFYFLGYRSTDGYRDNTDLEKYVASGFWRYHVSERTRIAFSARLSGYDGDAPGYLSREVVRAQPRSSAPFADQDGGDKEILHTSLHLDHAIRPDLDWNVRLYWQEFERERWVRFSEAGALQNRFDDQRHVGGISTLTWRIDDQWELDGGAHFELQDVVEQRFGTVGQTRTRDPSAVIRDFRYDFDHYGGYLRIAHTPNDQLGWNLGVRADRLAGDFEQFAADGTPTPRRMFNFGTIVQPTFNLFYAATEQVTLFANAGRSFQHPFGSAAYTTGDRDARDVSINDGWETGLTWQPLPALQLRGSFWRQDAKDEFVVVDGTAQNVGKTRRDGFDLSFNWFVSDVLYVWGNYTTVNSEIRRGGDAESAFVGNRLRSIPDRTSSLGLTYEVTEALTARVRMEGQGSYFVNEANLGGKFGSYTLFHANLEYAMNWGSLRLQLNNITNKFHEYVFDFSPDGSATIHSPGDGRSATATVNYRF